MLKDNEAQTTNIPIIYRSEPDSGLYDAMNKAVDLARGDYVVFLNSDDGLASPDVMKHAMQAIGAGAPDFIYGGTLQLMPDGSHHLSMRTNPSAFLQRMPFCHNSVLIRRDVFTELAGHDLRYRVGSDYDFVTRMLLRGYKGVSVPVPISMFSSRGASGNAMAVAQDYARIWLDHYAPYLPNGLSETDVIEWYRRGWLPISLCLALMRDRSLPRQVRHAARHSLGIALRRTAQPWRRWDNIGE